MANSAIGSSAAGHDAKTGSAAPCNEQSDSRDEYDENCIVPCRRCKEREATASCVRTRTAFRRRDCLAHVKDKREHDENLNGVLHAEHDERRQWRAKHNRLQDGRTPAGPISARRSAASATTSVAAAAATFNTIGTRTTGRSA